jgi:large subunit ribosomal protein L33
MSMFFSSIYAMASKSKRLVVKLVSAAETGFFYVTEKSPLKKDHRLALRKHDPIVNQHVMFYESKTSMGQKKKPMKENSMRQMRLTGKKVHLLVAALEKKKARLGSPNPVG